MRVALLTGRQTGRDARALRGRSGRAATSHVAVGTHALFQEGVEFRGLALAIVDEQHRFGVHQRLQLREKGLRGGRYPHQLVMTATPIPRTLAMTAYADLDVSVIDELPPGRTPMQTVVLPETRRDEVVERIRAACACGPAGLLGLSADRGVGRSCATRPPRRPRRRSREALPELRIGLVHGRMPPAAQGRRDDGVQARRGSTCWSRRP